MINKKEFWVITSLIFVAALSRLIPHPPNFTAVGSIALFGAAYFSNKKWALLIPFAALWISDLFLNHFIYGAYYSGWNAWFGNEWTYLGFIVIVVSTIPLLKKVNLTNVLGTSVLASGIFFAISNFGSWLSNPLIPKDFSGLILTYTAGIPFFWNTLGSTILFSIALFGVYELAIRPSFRLSTESI